MQKSGLLCNGKPIEELPRVELLNLICNMVRYRNVNHVEKTRDWKE